MNNMIEEILKQLKQVRPQYSTVLPVSGKTINFNPFKIRDQKTLSIIAQEDNIGNILKNICTILKDCSDITEPENLYIPDLEFLFLQIRSKSVEEEIKLIIKKETSITFNLKINNIICKQGQLEEHITLSDGNILELEQLKVKDFFDLVNLEDSLLIKKCIKALIIDKHRYDLTIFSSDELQKIINEISIKDEQLLKNFLKSAPHLYYSTNINGETIEVEGFLRFFTSV
jgi:hypothetical protein